MGPQTLKGGVLREGMVNNMGPLERRPTPSHHWRGLVKFVTDLLSQGDPKRLPFLRPSVHLPLHNPAAYQPGDTFSAAFSTWSSLTSQMDLKEC